MFSRSMFAEMRRAGFGVGISKSKLAQAMLEILVQLPSGTKDLKEAIVSHLGLMGQMCATRDINSAWNDTKRRAAREYPEKFLLDKRGTLHWNDGSYNPPDKEISAANFRKLNELANAENCSVNQLVSKLLRQYRKRDA
jgi:hypothetical protein